MKALIFEQFGGPEVLRYAEIPDPGLALGHIIVRTKAIGLNFADVYRRRGNYHLAGKPPFILGYEGAGIVEQVSPDVTHIQVGDRIAFCDVPFANSELVAVPVDRAIPVPSDITFEQAAGLLLQGMTAHYLVNDSYAVQAGDDVVVHAAAGGVGQLLIQLAKSKGARVIGLTSSEAKQMAALQAGADVVFGYDTEWAQEVIRFTEEKQGANVVYDSVGSTLMESFAAVRTKGTVVFYGMAGGDPPHVDPRMLMDSSKTLTGGDLWNHVTTLANRIERAEALFQALREGIIQMGGLTSFPLKDGAEAHRLIESRQSTGKILLIP
ncbi:quinone oxidoreductase [Paenibacillus sp. CGMCC 1.16610]|uniref:Zinc-binding dehydrogenase n=1 Tax=Paenibacillus anseongense TaxID=2682845 RepID=A0ABW9U4T4_9BACL|nr:MULTISPECIES: quinone oxidoreductase [Paenibacillus]MBA2940941.1 quinone oxidoreductase [Paenibacillus sp. CGMCC 1.16610]MVQ34124.1 zinc-binding dehydrogenase [Paenibacillus anseongense]